MRTIFVRSGLGLSLLLFAPGACLKGRFRLSHDLRALSAPKRCSGNLRLAGKPTPTAMSPIRYFILLRKIGPQECYSVCVAPWFSTVGFVNFFLLFSGDGLRRGVR